MVQSRSCSYAQFIATRMYIHFMCAYVYLHLHLFVILLIYWNAHFKYKSIVVFIRSSKVWFKTTSCAKGPVTPCNFPGNLQLNSTLKRCKLVTNVWYVKNILATYDGNVYLPILHLYKIRIALQVAKKIATCDRAFSASFCFESYLWTSNKYYNAFLICLKWTFQ